MTAQFAITIDTEEDHWDRYRPLNNAVENISSLMSLQKVFDKYNAVPTYLINWPVVTNEKSLNVIRKINSEHLCEIGTHCHPWNTPPHLEIINDTNSMMCNLDYELIKKKMDRLHEEISNKIGVEPISFRAGRWGFGSDVARCIKRLGYKIDTSITPFVDWKCYEGPNFKSALNSPYLFSPERLQGDVEGALLEVPPTIGFFQKNFLLCNLIRKLIIAYVPKRMCLLSILDKMNLLNFRWLSPELSSSEDMVKLIKKLIENNHHILNMSFHSTSLLPGKTPFVRNSSDLEIFMTRIEEVLKYCVRENIKFSTLRDVRMTWIDSDSEV